MTTTFLRLPAVFGAIFAFILGGLLLPEGVEAKNFHHKHIKHKKLEFTENFPLTDCNFLTSGTNPYFQLIENRVLHYDNMQCFADGDCDEVEELQITVLPDGLLPQ